MPLDNKTVDSETEKVEAAENLSSVSDSETENNTKNADKQEINNTNEAAAESRVKSEACRGDGSCSGCTGKLWP